MHLRNNGLIKIQKNINFGFKKATKVNRTCIVLYVIQMFLFPACMEKMGI